MGYNIYYKEFIRVHPNEPLPGTKLWKGHSKYFQWIQHMHRTYKTSVGLKEDEPYNEIQQKGFEMYLFRGE
jgi:uncharacterized protein YifE (UPF0438 family)